MSFDFARVKAHIEQQALAGLRVATEHALARAQHHAPVRAIFKRDRRGAAIPQRWKTIRTKERYQAFLRSKSRSRTVDVARFAGSSRRQQTTVLSSGRVYRGPIDVEGLDIARMGQKAQSGRGVRLSGRRFGGEGSRFAGHANTLIPVLRGNDYRVTADFRRFGAMRSDIVRQRTGQASRPLRAESFERRGLPHPGEAFRASKLTSRGRYEVRTARVARHGRTTKGEIFTSPPLFGRRVGGRLRGELRIRGPEKHSGSWWMYVESPTPYAPYQEFGTRRHRAQPFLRPALYESRNVLRFEVSKAVDKRFNALPSEGD